MVHKYMGSQRDNDPRGQLFWNRADVDGWPFRGREAPLLREEEFENRLVLVPDFKCNIFSLVHMEALTEADVPVLGRQDYQNLMDCVACGWFTIYYNDMNFDRERHWVYVEWLEWYYEDGKPARRPDPTTHNMQ